MGRTVSNALDILFSELSRMQTTFPSALDERIRIYFQQCLEKSVELAHDLPHDPACDLGAEMASLRRDADQLRANLGRQLFGGAIKAEAKSLVGPNAGLDAVQYACTLVARANIENMRILEAQLAGRYDDIAPRDPLFAGLRANGSAILAVGSRASFNEISLSAAVERFCEFNANHWVKKTTADVRRVMALAVALIGREKPIRSLDLEDVRMVRDALRKLPPNYIKLTANKERSLPEIIEGNISGQTLSLKTQDKYLAMFRGFLIWAENEGHIDKLPGKGVKVAGVGKINPAEQRIPYSNEQLQVIFSSPLFRGHHSEKTRHKPGALLTKDGKYWVPLIALYSGMRMGEIVQLLRSDIREEGGVWYFDVNKEEEKRIKTSSSKRRIPVHRILIEGGFLHFVEVIKNGDRIFSDIEPGRDGYYSHNLSKWWGRYAVRVGFKRKKTAFHSFRHNFIDASKAAELPEYISRALVGHSDRSVHAQYGSGSNLKSLKVAVDKIEYSIDLTFLTG